MLSGKGTSTIWLQWVSGFSTKTTFKYLNFNVSGTDCQMPFLATLALQSHSGQAGKYIHSFESHNQARPYFVSFMFLLKGRGQRTEVPFLPFGELIVQ